MFMETKHRCEHRLCIMRFQLLRWRCPGQLSAHEMNSASKMHGWWWRDVRKMAYRLWKCIPIQRCCSAFCSCCNLCGNAHEVVFTEQSSYLWAGQRWYAVDAYHGWHTSYHSKLLVSRSVHSVHAYWNVRRDALTLSSGWIIAER